MLCKNADVQLEVLLIIDCPEYKFCSQGPAWSVQNSAEWHASNVCQPKQLCVLSVCHSPRRRLGRLAMLDKVLGMSMMLHGKVPGTLEPKPLAIWTLKCSCSTEHNNPSRRLKSAVWHREAPPALAAGMFGTGGKCRLEMAQCFLCP